MCSCIAIMVFATKAANLCHLRMWWFSAFCVPEKFAVKNFWKIVQLVTKFIFAVKTIDML